MPQPHGSEPVDLLGASVSGISEGTDDLDPVEDLYDAFPDFPADLVSLAVRGAIVDGGALVCIILSYMGYWYGAFILRRAATNPCVS
jgi:hypothetical protein